MSLLYIYIEVADSFAMQVRECIPSRCRESRLLLYEEERVYLFSIEERETRSLFRGEGVSLLDREEAYSFSPQRRECFA